MKEPKFYKDSRKNSTPEGIFSLANMDYGELDSEGILSSANLEEEGTRLLRGFSVQPIQMKKKLGSEGILKTSQSEAFPLAKIVYKDRFYKNRSLLL